jgi:hypothetical protein
MFELETIFNLFGNHILVPYFICELFNNVFLYQANTFCQEEKVEKGNPSVFFSPTSVQAVQVR